MTNLETNMTNLRDTLNEYLEKPLELDSGVLSTQVNLTATSLSSGGLSGRFLIKDSGEIVVIDSSGIEAVVINEEGIVISDGSVDLITIDKTGITVNDGTNDRVKIGDIS
jgi:hypothetical protein